MADSPTYVFDDNGEIHAFIDGEHVASSSDMDGLERWVNKRVAAPPMPMPGPGGPPPGPDLGPDGPPMEDNHDDPSPAGMHVIFEGELKPAEEKEADPLPQASPDTIPGDDLPPRATHIITPNGLKGQILGKVKGLWSDEVTIRLENGRIAKFHITDNQQVEYVTEEKTVASPYQRMEAVLAEQVDPTKVGLRKRIAALKVVKDEAKASFSTAKYLDEDTLHNIVVEADAQIREVVDALEHMEQSEPYAPPEPQVFEQESMGGVDSTWLDKTVNDMIVENEAQDFDAMLEEVPEQLVAELETPMLEDSEGVYLHASAYLVPRIAGMDKQASIDFGDAFLRRVEDCRRAELEVRNATEKEPIEKQASTEDGPAEGLFW